MMNEGILSQLGLSGMIHVWGLPAAGKTLFATVAAAEVSRHSRVEWINCDGKGGFVSALKAVVKHRKGTLSNVTVSFPKTRESILSLITDLPSALPDDVGLVVIDPVTRVLDMARVDPVLWGRELIEEILPSLAGLVLRRATDVLITSESRTLMDRGTVAVHHQSIKRWCDHDILIQRSMMAGRSEIILNGRDEVPQVIGELLLTKGSPVEVISRRNIGQLWGGQ